MIDAATLVRRHWTGIREKEQKLMVIFWMKMRVSKNNRRDFLETVKQLLSPLRVQKGCIDSSLLEDFENDERLWLIQKWENESELRAHIMSYRFRWLLVATDLLSEAPEYKVSYVNREQILKSPYEMI